MAINRHKERETVFIMLFQAGFHKDVEAEELYGIFMEDLQEDRDYEDIVKSEYIKNTFLGALAYEDEARALIEKYSVARNINRISRVVMSSLLLAIYEIFNNDEIADAIAINEAVELAKVYDDKKASSFANGILGKIVAEK